jgi:hypothetical protein
MTEEKWERMEACRAQLGEWLPAAGPAFEVVAMRPGVANGLTYPAETLRASVAAGVWQGVNVYLDHPTALDRTRAGGRAVADLAGVVEEAWFDGAVRARLRCAGPRAELVTALARQMLADASAGRPLPRVGLSADLLALRDESGAVRQITRVHSLDVVVEPAAGGAFVRALNGAPASSFSEAKEMETMDTEMTRTPTETPAVEAAATLALARLQCEHALNAALRDAGLPPALERGLRQQFDGRLFSAEELAAGVAASRQTWAELAQSGVIRGLGRPRPAVGGMSDETDRVRLAWERALGLPLPAGSDAPRLSGIRELYLLLTGDHDFHGRLYPERAQLANATTSTMANIVADGLNKLLLQAYGRREKWWQPIVTHRDLDRFQTMKMIRPYGFSALSAVSEGAAYTEKTWDDLKETASIAKKGNYIGLTLEMILADDMDAVRAIPNLLGSAAYNTASDLVSAVFTDNSGTGPAMADTYNVFDATNHGNLRTVALAEDEFGVVATAMMNQTEPGSSRKLAVPPAYLIVPTALWAAAQVLRNTRFKTGSPNNDVNPWYQSFDVIVAPTWTDANNWAAVAPPAQVEGIVMGWLFGRQEPEIFVADSELAGSMFTNDEMRIKVRWFLCVGVADYRGLHKSNVA